MLPFTAVVTDSNITFSWQVMPGRWELLEQSGMSGEWKPLPAEKYHTNGPVVSATLPLPAQITLYRVKRNLKPTIAPPVMPPSPTNRSGPRPPGLPGRS